MDEIFALVWLFVLIYFFSFVSAMNGLNWFCISEQNKRGLVNNVNTQVNKVTTGSIQTCCKSNETKYRLKLRKDMRTFLKID